MEAVVGSMGGLQRGGEPYQQSTFAARCWWPQKMSVLHPMHPVATGRASKPAHVVSVLRRGTSGVDSTCIQLLQQPGRLTFRQGAVVTVRCVHAAWPVPSWPVQARNPDTSLGVVHGAETLWYWQVVLV